MQPSKLSEVIRQFVSKRPHYFALELTILNKLTVVRTPELVPLVDVRKVCGQVRTINKLFGVTPTRYQSAGHLYND